MKKAAILVLVVCFMSVASIASATSFDTTKYWSPYLAIEGDYSYTQNLDLPTPALSLNSAQLKITHKGNSHSYFEMWYVDGEHSISIGTLSDSEDSIKTDTFTLSSSILSEIMNNTPWSLYVKLDPSYSFDNLKLYSSEICGDYTEAVPEPASMILLGSALAGLVARRKFRK